MLVLLKQSSNVITLADSRHDTRRKEALQVPSSGAGTGRTEVVEGRRGKGAMEVPPAGQEREGQGGGTVAWWWKSEGVEGW